MASVNKVIIIGNLGKDPELRYTPAGNPVATLSVATSSTRKNRQTGQWETDTQWHRVIVLGAAAEWVGHNLKKGRTVYLEGALRYGSYTNRQSVQIPTVEIVTFQVEPFGAKPKVDQVDQPGDGAPGGNNSQPGPDDTLDAWVSEYERG